MSHISHTYISMPVIDFPALAEAMCARCGDYVGVEGHYKGMGSLRILTRDISMRTQVP